MRIDKLIAKLNAAKELFGNIQVCITMKSDISEIEQLKDVDITDRFGEKVVTLIPEDV